MTDLDVQRVLELCEQALAISEDGRAAFLDGACGDDVQLRRAVEALVAEPSPAENFLGRPAWSSLSPRLAAGTRLGRYEIEMFVGAGGMGQVYKARDKRLGRVVAIKVLPPDLADDPDRRRRFEQEASAVSALNHPNICTLYDVGSVMVEGGGDGAVDYIVMEYLDGQTLGERLKKGAVPVGQALEYATQIADALSKAHREGVVHRDLKPGNVMLTKSGAKLLDFGLAKLRTWQPAPRVPTRVATAESSITAQGTIVGTLAYMAPEQLEGKETDARSDLFSFGGLVYEMVTGRRAFEGDSHASVIAAILKEHPPPPSELQPLTPAPLDRLLCACLAKEPDDRPDTAHDVASELRRILETSGEGRGTVIRAPRRSRALPWFALAGLALGGVVGASATWLLIPRMPGSQPVHSSISVQPAEELSGGNPPGAFLTGRSARGRTPGGARTALALTPDGGAIVFAGLAGSVRRLYIRRLDGDWAVPIPNTEGAQVPAVSSDGQWVAFWADGAIKKIRLTGGLASDLAAGIQVPPWGLAWDSNGRLFMGNTDGRIWMIPREGQPTPVTALHDGEVAHTLPCPLPNARGLLYTVRKREWSWGDEETVVEELRPGGTRKVVRRGAVDARYVVSGHLVLVRRGRVFAVPFDISSLEVVGNEVPVLGTVAQALTGVNMNVISGASQLAVSPNGIVAWLPGTVNSWPKSEVVTVERRTGRVTALAAPRVAHRGPLRLSPDHRRLAMAVSELNEVGLWIFDLDSGRSTPLLRGGEATWPVWSLDGQRIYFAWLKDGRRTLASIASDGSESRPEVIMSGDFRPSAFAPDGRLVATAMQRGGIVFIGADGHVTTLSSGSRNTDRWPAVSPTGRLLAYGSDVSNRFEVYVRPLDGTGAPEQVSANGGSGPIWHPNGRELFFLGGEILSTSRSMMSATCLPGRKPGMPRREFEFAAGLFEGFPVRMFDISPDGERFYLHRPLPAAETAAVTQIQVVVNWFDELKANASLKR